MYSLEHQQIIQCGTLNDSKIFGNNEKYLYICNTNGDT